MAKSKNKTSRKAVEPREAEVVETKTRRVEVEPVNDNSVVKKIVVVVLLIIGLFLLLNIATNWGDRSDEDQAGGDDSSQVEGDESKEAEGDDEEEAIDSNGTSVKESEAEFNYVVGGGESYTTIARRAIASLNGELAPAERVAAETKLVSDAGAEWINEGQALVLSKDTVQAAIDWAKSLSAEEKAAWQPYADLVAW